MLLYQIQAENELIQIAGQCVKSFFSYSHFHFHSQFIPCPISCGLISQFSTNYKAFASSASHIVSECVIIQLL